MMVVLRVFDNQVEMMNRKMKKVDKYLHWYVLCIIITTIITSIVVVVVIITIS